MLREARAGGCPAGCMWLSGRALVAQARGVLGLTPSALALDISMITASSFLVKVEIGPVSLEEKG